MYMEKRQASADDVITLGMCEAGARSLMAHINDSEFMAKPNWSGELAARVFRAMADCSARKDNPAIRQAS